MIHLVYKNFYVGVKFCQAHAVLYHFILFMCILMSYFHIVNSCSTLIHSIHCINLK